MKLRVITSLSIWFVATCVAYAQNTSTLYGKVVDSAGKAVPFLNIFFANTTLGTTSNEIGEYKLINIPNGKYNLTVSGIGYKVISVPLEVIGNSIEKNIVVNEDIKTLNEIEVKSRPDNFKKYLPVFRKYFLGETANASLCKILNLEAIDLNYNEQNHVLTATAQEPIEIENKALGYKIFYLLQTFSLDTQHDLIFLSGIPRFVELVPEKDSQQKKWNRNRDKAYLGSVTHFIKSLFEHTLNSNGFIVSEIKNEKEYITSANVLLNNDVVQYHGKLKVVYEKESEEYNYSHQNNFYKPQTSILSFPAKAIKIYQNGYFEDQLGIVFNGYMGWERLAELMPLEYRPSKNK
jgi:hypothetical protein